ncbi:MAG: FAD-dependent oxidoreductase [Mailhella sp.]|nr:FAD-dependent oxidoreductase [Mailhella sp.]
MPQLIYGVWDNVVYDNRGTAAPVSPDLPLVLFDQFNEGNPTEIFLSNRGFLVFSESASLVWALWKHHERLAAESCGKCSPCRSGSQLLAQQLELACRGEQVNWGELRDITVQMHDTSLCGVGRTGTTPLLYALTYFPDALRPSPYQREQGFYSVTTSPCIEACPSHVNVPRYIDYLQDGHNDLAAGVVLKHYPLAGSCGRVCVRYCEKACRRAQVDEAVDIKNLKRFAADKTIVPGILHPDLCSINKNKRVAVIGAGPVGVTCAYQLLEMGYPVDIYEAHDKAGGMVRYGIPFYRLPKNVLDQENELVKEMGGMFFFEQKLGRDFHIDDLFRRGYKAVFIATGCPKGGYLGMDGEDTSLPGYENGIDFLEKVHDSLEAGVNPTLEGDVVVVGGGNVAMDCCRSAVRMTKGKVHLVYRRTEADAPADHQEIVDAMKEGVEFHFLTGQDKLVVEDGKLTGLACVAMQQTEPDASGRRGVKPIADSGFVIPCDHVIAAIGQMSEPDMLVEADGIACDRKNIIIVDEYQATSRPGVFAGGDGTTGPRSKGPSVLIHGMAQGTLGAHAIASYLEDGKPPFIARERISMLIKQADLFGNDPVCGQEKKPRVKMNELEPAERAHNFKEVEKGMSQEEAWQEAKRCMRCYRIMSVITRSPIPGSNA